MWFNTLCEESCLNVGYLIPNIHLLNNFAGTEFGKLSILNVIELQKFLIWKGRIRGGGGGRDDYGD